MNYLRRKRELITAQSLTVEEARTILERIPSERLEDLRDFALLLTAMGTGMRMKETLDLRIEQLVNLPKEVHELAGGYFVAVIEMGLTQPRDYLFPNLVWMKCGASVPLTPRIFVVTLKQRAAMAGIAPERIHPGTWRQTAGIIHRQAGGFGAFAGGLCTGVFEG